LFRPFTLRAIDPPDAISEEELALDHPRDTPFKEAAYTLSFRGAKLAGSVSPGRLTGKESLDRHTSQTTVAGQVGADDCLRTFLPPVDGRVVRSAFVCGLSFEVEEGMLEVFHLYEALEVAIGLAEINDSGMVEEGDKELLKF